MEFTTKNIGLRPGPAPKGVAPSQSGGSRESRNITSNNVYATHHSQLDVSVKSSPLRLGRLVAIS